MNPPSSLPSTTKEKLSKDVDVTERDRSPVEDAFCESFLLQSRSDIESLYASNIYWSQKHAKEVKDLNRQKMVVLSSMSKEQKEMVKRMQKLQEKQEQLVEVKMKQFLATKVNRSRRIRPHSTSAVPNDLRLRPEPPRPRSGSSSLLDPLGNKSDLVRASRLSKSSQNLNQLSPLEMSKEDLKSLSLSCENLSTLDSSFKQTNKLVLPAITPRSRSKSSGNLSEDDSFFITKIDQSTSNTEVDHKLIVPAEFSPERRRGSLPNPAHEVDRMLGLERQSSVDNEPVKQFTNAKWVPKTVSKSLPSI